MGSQNAYNLALLELDVGAMLIIADNGVWWWAKICGKNITDGMAAYGGQFFTHTGTKKKDKGKVY